MAIKFNVVEHSHTPMGNVYTGVCKNYNLNSLGNTSEVSGVRFVDNSFLL